MDETMRMVQSLDGSFTIEAHVEASQNENLAELDLVGLPEGAIVSVEDIATSTGVTRRFNFQIFDFSAPVTHMAVCVTNEATGEVVESTRLLLPGDGPMKGTGYGATTTFDEIPFMGSEILVPETCGCCVTEEAEE